MIQRTLVLIKADGVERSVSGEIISRFERAGLKMAGMKMIWVDKKFAKKHYPDIEQRYNKRVYDSLANYLTEGPVIALCLEGVGAVEVVRKLVGSTYPNESQPGTIRGDYAHISKVYANKKGIKVGNLIHASANPKEAKQEVDLWFTPTELFEYKILNEFHTR